MKTLLLDNYDSFTYNLFQYVAELGGDPVVVLNDEKTPDEIVSESYSHIILSPGPGNPDTSRDIGVSRAVIDLAMERGIPLLGVCLGHQVLAVRFGGTVERAPEIFHGRASKICFSSPRSVLFDGIPEPMEAMRYHSLCVTAVPDHFHWTARTDEGVVMAMEHDALPLFGIQFHPESIGTPEGKTILQSFLSLT